jgi:hypothetical protein
LSSPSRPDLTADEPRNDAGKATSPRDGPPVATGVEHSWSRADATRRSW